MREIKFRAWDDEKQEMYYTSPEGHSQSYARLQLLSGSWGMYDSHHDEMFTADHDKLMQFTGLKDKNGVEVYEGDILKDTHGSGWQGTTIRTGRVLYNTDPAGFTFGSGWSPLNSFDIQRMEVIGNIYENPELLETKQ